VARKIVGLVLEYEPEAGVYGSINFVWRVPETKFAPSNVYDPVSMTVPPELGVTALTMVVPMCPVAVKPGPVAPLPPQLELPAETLKSSVPALG